MARNDNMNNDEQSSGVVCDFANPKGLDIGYVLSSNGKEVTGEVWCDEKHEGYPGVMHGGVIAAIFDGAMGNCLFACGKAAVTVEMTTKFRSPVLIDKTAKIVARIKRTAYPLCFLEAEMVQDGKVRATATGKFYERPELIDVLEQF